MVGSGKTKVIANHLKSQAEFLISWRNQSLAMEDAGTEEL